MVAEIEKFIEIENNLEQILKDSPFKMSYIIEKTGIKKPTFFRKLKEKKFSSEEILEIAKAVEIKQWRNETKEEILESLKRSEEDFKNGRGIDGRTLINEMRQRLKNHRKDAV